MTTDTEIPTEATTPSPIAGGPAPKLAVVVRDDLATWQKLNVTAFVTSGIGTLHPDLIGAAYRDGSGRRYLPMLGHPVLILVADRDRLRRAFDRAIGRGLAVSVYTDDLFATGNDLDNRAAVEAVPTDGLSLAGMAVAGPARQVDKALDKHRLHP
jgi:hypothetical protein